MSRQPRRNSPFRKSWLLLGMVAGMAPAIGYGDIILVNNAGDSTQDPTITGFCSSAPVDGACTLRAAIQFANSTPGEDTIYILRVDPNLSQGGAGENLSEQGDLDITAGPLIIAGVVEGDRPNEYVPHTRTVTAFTGDRVFHILNGAKVTIKDLVISGGKLNAPDDSELGGGGILVQGSSTLILERVSLTGNRVEGTSYLHSGGGLFVDESATATITDSAITYNTDKIGGAGVANAGRTEIANTTIANNDASGAWGGGIRNLGGYLHIGNSTISDNLAQHGGGIYSSESGPNVGYVIVSNSAIHSNRATFFGGGIHNESPFSITNSSIYNNESNGRGGGINNASLGNMDIINSTISGNEVLPLLGDGNSDGGGIYTSRDVSLTNVTLYNNVARPPAGGVGGNQLAVVGSNPSVTLANTIIANGEKNNFSSTTACAGQSGYFSMIHSLSGNLTSGDPATSAESNNSCGLFASEKVNVNPTDLGLAPLSTDSPTTGAATYTGMTPYHALTSSLSAAANNAKALCPDVDQRFMQRSDGKCDIGAYEFGANINQTKNWVDLKVTISDSADPVKPGASFTYKVVLSNLYAKATATGFQLVIDLPDEFSLSLEEPTFTSSTDKPVCDAPTTPGNIFVCDVFKLPGLGRIEMFINGTHTQEGTWTAVARTSNLGTSFDDAFMANNSDTEETKVDGAAGTTDNFGGNNVRGGGGGGALHPWWLVTLGGLLLARRRR